MQWVKQDICLGDNLQKIRKSCNLTQQQVVTKMQLLGSSMSRSTYSNVEAGIRNIKVSDLIILKQVFDVDYSEFFEGLLSI